MKKDTQDNKTIYIILGNGFSINLVNLLNRCNDIDLSNLFNKGDNVPWPDNKYECFLSKKHCSALWDLGARTTTPTSASVNLIDNLITSMNAHYLYLNDAERINGIKQTTYYYAYCQLVSYLKNLFIYYNGCILDSELDDLLHNHKFLFLEFINAQIKQNNKIRIITYNYDVFLERMLARMGIDFKLAGFHPFDSTTPLVIYKPHGSISFETKTQLVPHQPYNCDKDPFSGAQTSLDELKLNMNPAKDKSIINPIIPPSGDANRVGKGWEASIKKLIHESLSSAKNVDELIIYGISYNHVDRNELDDILTTLPYCINVQNINPTPSDTFEMVLASIFTNYSHYKSFYWEA